VFRVELIRIGLYRGEPQSLFKEDAEVLLKSRGSYAVGKFDFVCFAFFVVS